MTHANGFMIDDNVIDREHIVAANDAIAVAGNRIVEDLHRVFDGRNFIFFKEIAPGHHADSSCTVFVNQVVLDEKRTIRDTGIFDKLDAIMQIIVNDIAPNDVVDGGACIIL